MFLSSMAIFFELKGLGLFIRPEILFEIML
jgi:hypothetical protein